MAATLTVESMGVAAQNPAFMEELVSLDEREVTLPPYAVMRVVV